MKRLIVGLLIALGGIGLIGGGDDQSQSSVQNVAPTSAIETKVVPPEIKKTAPDEVVVEKKESPKVTVPSPSVINVSESCGSDYYRNVDGKCVHRPQALPSAPSNATARCRDGTYSYSQNHRGTCSRHGGVASWL
jgi:Protein of unknown function (DUF3761)